MGSVDWFLTWLERTQLLVPIIVEEVRQDGLWSVSPAQGCPAGLISLMRSYVAAATHTNLSGAVGEANISLGFQGDRLYGLSRMLSLP